MLCASDAVPRWLACVNSSCIALSYPYRNLFVYLLHCVILLCPSCAIVFVVVNTVGGVMCRSGAILASLLYEVLLRPSGVLVRSSSSGIL